MKREQKTSVRSIAQHLGLSPATVSLALNGRRPTGFVSAATRKQVWEAAEQMGYPLERLRSTRPLLDRVGVFMAAGPNPVYSETVLELCRALNLQRIQALTYLVWSQREAYTMTRELHRKNEIDAAVFIGSRDEVITLDFPTVFVGEVPPGEHIWQVRIDNEGAGRRVGEHLWSLGHRSIAMLLPDRMNMAGELRLQGLQSYWAGQSEGSAASHVPQMEPVMNSDDAFRKVIAESLESQSQSTAPVTALYCFNDWMAGKTLKILREMKIGVPEQMSVVGFDDSIYAELLDPPLTTMHTPFDRLGSLAAELLLEQGRKPAAEPRTVVAPCWLVERLSSAKAVTAP